MCADRWGATTLPEVYSGEVAHRAVYCFSLIDRPVANENIWDERYFLSLGYRPAGMRATISFLFLFLSVAALAQVPEPALISLKVLGGAGGDQVDQFTSNTPDGGFIMTSSTSSLAGPFPDTFCHAGPSYVSSIFIKYNADGNVREWFKCRKSSWSDTGYIFMFDAGDDTYIFGGEIHNGNLWFVRKETAGGSVLWTKAYGGSSSQMLYSMTPTDDGGYILFGSAYGGDGDIGFHYGGFGKRDFWVLKVDMNGNKVWSKVYGGMNEDLGCSVVPGPNGGCYIVGSTNSTDHECSGNHGGTDAFVARLNNDGNIIWRRVLGGSGLDGGGEGEGSSSIPNGSGGILIATISGSADGDVSHQINNPGSNIWVINMDSASNIVWDKCYGGGGAEYPNSICYGTDGTIWIMGCSQNSGGQVNASYGKKDTWLVHTDGAGNFLNAKVLGSTGSDVGYMVHPLSDGSVLTGGYYGAGDGVFPGGFQGGFLDAYFAKFAPWPDEIEAITTGNSVSVFPNPANGKINIVSPSVAQVTALVTDLVGNTVYRLAFSERLQIQTDDWAAGTYLVQVIDENGYREVKRIVIQ